MNIKTLITMTLALAILPFLGSVSRTAEPEKGKDSAADAGMAELQKQFQSRFPRIAELKKSGTVGETADGLIAVREGGDDQARKLVDDENADRKELYGLIGKKEGTTADVVAARAGKRNFEKAKAGEWLKGEDGKWKQK